MFELYPDLMSVVDVQNALRIGRSKAYELINTGQILSIRVGNKIRVPKPQLLEFIQHQSYNNGEVDRRRYCEGGCDEDNR